MSKQDDSAIQFRRMRKKEGDYEVSESWAISYSDLLMVLMSFFIIYFNADDKNEARKNSFDSVILKLSSSLELKDIEEKKVAVKNSGTGEMKEMVSKLSLKFNLADNAQGVAVDANKKGKLDRTLANREEDNSLISSVSSGFTGQSKTKEKANKNIEKYNEATSTTKNVEIEIDFSENLFEVGKYNLTNKAKKELDNLFGLITDAKEDLRIIFVGHTDKIQFKENNKNVVNSNLILSSLRAAKAVEYALSKGFDDNQVFVQGLNDQPRNTRSLSVRLVER